VSRFDDTLETGLDVEFENSKLDIGSEVALGMHLVLADGVSMEAAFARFSPGNSLGAGVAQTDYYEITVTYEF